MTAYTADNMQYMEKSVAEFPIYGGLYAFNAMNRLTFYSGKRIIIPCYTSEQATFDRFVRQAK